MLLCNNSFAFNRELLTREYKAGEEKRLEEAGAVLLQEAIDDAVYPEYVVKKLQRDLDRFTARYKKNPKDVDALTRIKMLEKSIKLYHRRVHRENDPKI